MINTAASTVLLREVQLNAGIALLRADLCGSWRRSSLVPAAEPLSAGVTGMKKNLAYIDIHIHVDLYCLYLYRYIYSCKCG